jgi:hypothetical protein
VVVIQNELAIAQSRGRQLPRLIWVPDGTESKSPEQQAFIKALHTTEEAQFGADLLTADLESLKTAMRATLEKLERPETPKREAAQAAAKLLYVICDPRDRKSSIPLRRQLQRPGIELEIPVFVGDAASIRRANEELLASCDAVVIFYGEGDEAWKRTVESDIRKAAALRADKKPVPRFTYLSEPATDDKLEAVELQEPHLLNGLGGATPDVEPIIDAVQRA